MENMSKLFFLLMVFIVCLSNMVTAQQYMIRGTVINKDNQPVEFVHASLFKNDTIIVVQASTDTLGFFSLKAERGSYLLRIEQYGVKHLSKEIDLFQDIDLEETIIDESVLLEGVTITARKKLIERKIDRLVFNVENSIASQGMDGLDALRNTPMVRVEKENISIIGKSGVAVMINDRILNLSDSELTNYLQSLRSDDIAKIEVITTPPSKFEAQGNSGIINIVLKKNLIYGWSGNLTATYTRRSENNYANNATVNYLNNRFVSSLKIRHLNNRKQSSEVNTINAVNSLESDDRRLDMNDGMGFNFSADYAFSKKSNMGIIYDLGYGLKNMDISNISIYKTKLVTDSLLSTYAEHRQKEFTNTLNIYFDHKIDSTGKKVSIGVNYFSYNPENRIDFATTNQTTNSSNSYLSINRTKYNVWSGQVDLILPYEYAMIDMGLKTTFFNNTSDLKYYKIEDCEPMLMPDGLNRFDYTESNYAIYLSMDKKISDRLSAKGGLRYEYSIIRGYSPLSGEENKDDYGHFFPTAYITYKPGGNSVFSLSYARRINRPFFRALNPNRWYTNPYTFSKGNMLLKPSYNDNIDFGYSFKNKLNVSIFYQRVNNAYSQMVSYSDGIKVIDYVNMYNQTNIGIDAGYYDLFFRLWEVALTANLYHTESQGIIPQVIGQKSFNFSYDIGNTLSLNRAKTVRLFLNYFQMLPASFGNFKTGVYSILNTGVRMSFMQKKLQTSLFFEDIFKKAVYEGETFYADFIMKNRNYYDTRSFNISINYSFGNGKVKGMDKKIDFDEKNRAR